MAGVGSAPHGQASRQPSGDASCSQHSSPERLAFPLFAGSWLVS